MNFLFVKVNIYIYYLFAIINKLFTFDRTELFYGNSL
jgi:hypothetical protein